MQTLFLFVSLAAAQDVGPAWLKTGRAAALNPKLSVLGDFVAASGPTRAESGLTLRELEIALQADVDPYARLDVFLSKPDGEALEVEEGYATLTALPWHLQARAGKFRALFGRLNWVHSPELPQVDRPLAVSRYLGGEGLNEVGGEVSRVFAPFGFFTEVSYAFMNGLGEAEEEPVTTTINDVDGNPVTVRVEEAGDPAPKRLRDYAHVARARLFRDLGPEADVEVGVSGALHQPKGALHRSLLGAELTARWKPEREGMYKSLIWRSEWLWSRRRLPDEFDLAGVQTESAAKVDRRGGYSYAQYQWARRWSGGLRADYVEDPDLRASRSVTRALSPYLNFTTSEFSRLRLQWQRQWLPSRRKDDLLQLQWTLALGPHGAHPY